MLIKERLLQERNRIRDRTFKKNLKRSIYRLHNKTIKNVRKRQYLNNTELEIRNNTFQDDYRKKERQEDMTRLLENNVKTLRNLKKNTNRSRINIHKQEMKGLYKENKHIT